MTDWATNLINEYVAGRKQLNKLRDSLDQEDIKENEKRKLVGNMISDMTYAIDWLKSGRMPGNRRGADRHAVYQKTVFFDTNIFESVFGSSDDLDAVDTRIDAERML